MTSTDNDFL